MNAASNVTWPASGWFAAWALGMVALAPMSARGQDASSASPPLKQGELYTAHNIWFERPDRLSSINYKRGNIIPAGAVVSNVRLVPGRKAKLVFHYAPLGADFTVFFQAKHHPGVSLEAFRDRMFTNVPVEKRTAGMSEVELNAIRAGQVHAGMSKKAVLISWGYPPEHRTMSTKLPRWQYWISRFGTKTLVFDEDERLVVR